MRRALLSLSLAAVLSLALSSAQAAVVQVLDATNAWDNPQVNLAQTTGLSGGTWQAGQAASTRQGNDDGDFRSPFDGSGGNSTPDDWEQLTYFAVGPTNPFNPATLEFDKGQTSLTLLWGSVDDYNTLEFLDDVGAVILTVTSATLSGEQGGGVGAALVSVTDILFHGIRFTSIPNNAFEFSNIVTTAVPIPPALVLFGSALAGLGYLMRRRRATGPQPA
jgi:hypothetical protein